VLGPLDFRKQLLARILGIQLGKLPQNLLRPLILHLGNDDSDLHDLVTPPAFVNRRGNPLLSEAEFLTGLGSRRYLQVGSPALMIR
jgi:hypothetical protein